MLTFQYPTTGNVPSWLADYNRRVQGAGFYPGKFGLALDVWRDDQFLFGSYNYEQAERMDDWARRNYPGIDNVDFRSSAMGVQVPGIDNYTVPTRAAFDHAISLKSIELILRAALATAQFPRNPENLDIVPSQNSMRQRLYQLNDGRDWLAFRINDLENKIVMRAVVGRSEYDTERVQMAHYQAALIPRQSTMETHLKPCQVTFEAPAADMTSVEHRRPILKAAKKELNIVGYPGRVTDALVNQCTFSLGSHPFDLLVSGTPLPMEDIEPTKGGFDL